jgi:hypothetical protein
VSAKKTSQSENTPVGCRWEDEKTVEDAQKRTKRSARQREPLSLRPEQGGSISEYETAGRAAQGQGRQAD